MTLTSTTPRVQYDGDDATVAFPVTFTFWDATDLQVILTDADGVETTWVNGTQYSVTGGSGAVGTVTVSTSPTDYTPATGEKLTIISNLTLEQTTDLPTGGALPSSSIEEQFDKNVRLTQQQAEALGRALKLKKSSTFSSLELPDPEADKVLGWTAAGTALENKTPNTQAYLSVSAYALTLLDDASALAARATLGLVIGTNVLAPNGSGSSLTGLIKQGVHTEYYDASAFQPTVSNGCAALAQLETTAGRPDINYLAFDGSADEHAQIAVVPPKKWNGGTVTFRVYHTHPSAITTGVAWGLQGVAIDNDETIDVAYGTAVVVTDTYLNAAEDMHITATSAAVTIAGSPDGGGDEFVVFRLFRDVSDAADDTATDAYLLGIDINWTINAGDDS